MKKKTLMSVLAAIIFGLFPVVDVVRAEGSAASERLTMMESSQTQSRRFGPYATVDRANQVANYARRLGYNAQVIYAGCFYCGTREYYVDVWK